MKIDMKQQFIEKTPFEGLYVINITKHFDKRGYFSEIYNKKEWNNQGLNMIFVQDNEILSKKGVIRGLDIQVKHPQGKLVKVSKGKIYDVVVDYRKGSKTFGRWYGIYLSEVNNKQLYIPPGFAHGYYTLSEIAICSCKVTEYWYPEEEIYIPWNDENLNIKWSIIKNTKPILIKKQKGEKA